MRSHEKRRWLFEQPTQSQISTSILKYTTINLVQLKHAGTSRRWLIFAPPGTITCGAVSFFIKPQPPSRTHFSRAIAARKAVLGTLVPKPYTRHPKS